MTRRVAITGLAVSSAFGRGGEPLLAGALAGRPAFAPVRRFDVSGRRVGVAATSDSDGSLLDELAWAVSAAAGEAGAAEGTPLLLAVHGDPGQPRVDPGERVAFSPAAFARRLGDATGMRAERVYTSACVAASTALADAAAAIVRGAGRVIVAGGYLVEQDQFALFDAGRALAVDGQVRPFSTGRSGLLLGDGVAAVVLEPAGTARHVLGTLDGWGRSGDAHHVVQPHPDGEGLARAISAALSRAGIGPAGVGYVNAHGSGTPYSDVAETAALHRAGLGATPISSTKSVHGQALEASGILELAVTLLALRAGQLPPNAGYLGPDAGCDLNLVLEPQPVTSRYAVSLNAAFGGANTALVVGAP
ncbi:beta-ketoacyl-[acyl-carrier-protein] synthase family protein [Longispora albida]|uniref:beta-ketoacyl-[acyl-carrier-protein] synthase family protein n=1 Tax=Longispora albida TaxID=203523 RepID=UPI0003622A23|nr:beta-ketoacyl synthase N-terminal-like domain-containing protein [Longispora albida]